MPLHGRYKAVTLRSCNVDPCIRTRISRGFQNCAQIDLNQHARKTIRQKPQIALPSTCRVPASTLQNSWNLRDRWRCPNLLYGPAPVWIHMYLYEARLVLVSLSYMRPERGLRGARIVRYDTATAPSAPHDHKLRFNLNRSAA